MNTKTKTSLVIVAIFMIGVIAGSLGSYLLFQYKVKQIVYQRSPQKMLLFLERVIEPTLEQRDAIHALLQKHGYLIFESIRENREKQLQQFETLKNELAEILTPRQMDRLEEHLNKRGRIFGRQPPGNGPKRRPPGQPGGKNKRNFRNGNKANPTTV